MKKIKKLVRNPEIFFRDYLNKRYPIINNEQQITEPEEAILIKNDINLSVQDTTIYSNNPIIDVVFTWVNNNDDKWLKKYKTHTEKYSLDTIGLYANDQARFSNHNELFYSVQSIEKFMPWVRQIYIVTDDQEPDWLDKNNRKIKVIDHKEIIKEEFLPTFNSHIIEAHLHKIEGLSENFIYFNDDVFVARKLLPQHFFRSNGIASLFIATKSLKNMQQKGKMTPTLAASQNGAALLKKYFSANIDAPLVHTYVPLKKSAYSKAWNLFHSEIQAFLPNKFRTNSDLNLATFLVPWLMYLDGQSVFEREICYYFNIRSPHALTQYNNLIKNQKSGASPHSFCANDFNSEKSTKQYQQNLINLLEKYYRD
ncbi:MAG: Stealth CR1 domain-containing protein [Neisseria sp.]|uniref:Stealth CR1 domain-containing protein n=1 Tax=Neisseria sp. TaxID=192066 RepID=UPI0026DD9C59|nr:Stealth CR1 domain-containing protein [Neisseria sp.]MDO4640276.1 Stealth CR1 domain-containing protein [Neisseria sp.]